MTVLATHDDNVTCNQSISEDTQVNSELQTWFDELKSAYQAEPLAEFEVRKQRLVALKKQLSRYQDVLAQAMSEDFGGRCHTESVMADVLGPILDINHVVSHLKGWMKPSRRSTEWLFKGNKLEVRYQPKGVVGIICPWNFPLYLSIGPMITALAAGNRCMIKMPPNCPSTTNQLRKMLAEIYPENLVRVVDGNHPEAMEISNLAFDHLVFTGSPASGKTIMANAAKNLTPVTLELGGKSPAIVFDDYDIYKAAARIAHGKSLNSGQICIAPDYAFVPEEKQQAFVEAVQKAYQAMYKKIEGNNDYTSLVDDAQYQRFHALLSDARDKGAKITKCLDDGEGRKEPLYIATNLTPDMRICQEEIFGPLLPVHGYSSVEDVVGYINERPRPLACYLFSNDKEQREVVLNQTHSGGVTINDWGWHAFNHSVPFGGVGNSGIGNYHGEEGFRELSHARSVLKVQDWFPTKLLSPPYGNMVQKLLLRLFVGKPDPKLKK
ncbi:coniferyl aldehyde dehydrogenase [Vibrio sp. B1FLJ16]|uniref:coniferyl aldehyde dehydrogenase n=1 Tax=Vibrio sp. B1FLJ16 TaxID=2751178 RepID=UPI0015F56626|nr:coniferyl aldehyde dehydrogenase [Vibrio sp. B1FLJ16]CAD7809022.1 Belongs to the aldehyde dehydrogenase family [Vibrio sp. B1FLJ16]CAE6909693.1 Belongs to the aldehyde dehydrogenase family [Vibrio sp. B1FLJ16]